jgi:hypothetical protein
MTSWKTCPPSKVRQPAPARPPRCLLARPTRTVVVAGSAPVAARPRLRAWRAGGGQAAPDRMCGSTVLPGVSSPGRAVPAALEHPASLGRTPRSYCGRSECAARQRPAVMVAHAAGRGVGACAGCADGAYRSPIAPAALYEQRCRTASAPTCLCGSCGFAALSATFQMEEATTGIRKSSARSADCMPASWRLVCCASGACLTDTALSRRSLSSWTMSTAQNSRSSSRSCRKLLPWLALRSCSFHPRTHFLNRFPRRCSCARSKSSGFAERCCQLAHRTLIVVLWACDAGARQGRSKRKGSIIVAITARLGWELPEASEASFEVWHVPAKRSKFSHLCFLVPVFTCRGGLFVRGLWAKRCRQIFSGRCQHGPRTRLLTRRHTLSQVSCNVTIWIYVCVCDASQPRHL